MSWILTTEQLNESHNINGIIGLTISILWFIIYLCSRKICPYILRERDTSIASVVMTPNGHISNGRIFSYAHLSAARDNKCVERLALLYPSIYIFRYALYVLHWNTAVQNRLLPLYIPHIIDGGFVFGTFVFNLLIIVTFQNGVKLRDSIYIIKLGKLPLVISYVLLAASTLLNATFYIKRHLSKSNENISERIHYNLFWILALDNIILGTVLIASFSHQIYIFMSLRGGYGAHRLNLAQRQYLELAVRYTVLYGTAIALTNIQFSGWMVLNFDWIKSTQSVLRYTLLWSWLWILVLFINFYCIYLSFANSTKHYHCICCCCHVCGERLCTVLAIATMERHRALRIQNVPSRSVNVTGVDGDEL